MRKKVIIFLGPQGAGKTTLINELLKKFKTYKVQVVQIQYNNLFAYIFYKFLLKLKISRKYMYCGRKIEGVRRDILKKLGFLWIFLNVMSVALLSLIRVHIPSRFSYVILCERSALDTYISLVWGSIILKSGKLNKRVRSLLKLFISLIPRDSLIICVDASYETLKKRWVETGKPIECSAYIELQKRYMYFFSKIFKEAIYIRTEECSIKKSLKTIIKYVGV
ncbi:MAG: ATP-binding protein [Candidatus Baldrarchaeia archaeon]